ncbi:hypothetical protein HDU82_007984, partial [Entophlyctis luteolus]
MQRVLVVALSGGVDSAVSALLLKAVASAADCSLRAVFLRNWSLDPGDCVTDACPNAHRDFLDARATAKALNIPLSYLDLSREYWTRVFEPMVSSLERGYTPNPDVSCNKFIKFGALANFALRNPHGTSSSFASSAANSTFLANLQNEIRKNLLRRNIVSLAKTQIAKEAPIANPIRSSSSLANAADYLVTGHYARILIDKQNDAHLLRAIDRVKDQSYFLSTISKEVISRAIFPVGGMLKSEVKKLAADACDSGIDLHHVLTRRESMGICFVEPSEKFGDFIGRFIEHSSGDFVDIQVPATMISKGDGAYEFFLDQPENGIAKGQHAAFYVDEMCMGGGDI